jgi:Mg2+/Co2+ transporter CorB
MSWHFASDGPKTLNGLIIEHLEDIPEANLSVRISGYPIEIIDVNENMIKVVRILPQFFNMHIEEDE